MAVRVYVIIMILTLVTVVKGRHVIDLTHTLDKNAPKYPLNIGIDVTYFNQTTLIEKYHDGIWASVKHIEFYEHIGTHIDAPYHFGAGRQTLEQIPVDRLIGPGVIIDVQQQVHSNPNYGASIKDILDHEAKYGMIPHDSIIIMNSGWAKYYPDSTLVFGTHNISDPWSFNFPGWSEDACKFLLQERRVGVLGVDTPSTDPGQAAYPCHTHLQTNNVPLLEYVANLDSIPPRGTTIMLGAPKVRLGTGGPTRIIAFVDGDRNDQNSVATASVDALSACTCSYLLVVMLSLFG